MLGLFKPWNREDLHKRGFVEIYWRRVHLQCNVLKGLSFWTPHKCMRGNVKETLLGSPYSIILLWGFQVYWKLNFEIRGGMHMHLGNCKMKMFAKHSLYVKNVMECFCTKREIHQEIILCRKKRRSISPLASTRREERNALVLRSLLIYSIQRGWKSGKWMLDV